MIELSNYSLCAWRYGTALKRYQMQNYLLTMDWSNTGGRNMGRIISPINIAISLAAVTACTVDSPEGQGLHRADVIERAWVSSDAASRSTSAPAVCQTLLTSGSGPCTGSPPCCPDGFACLFQDSDRGGFRVAISAGCGIADLRTIACPECTNGVNGNDGTFNDQMSSWANRSGEQYCWYADVEFQSVRAMMPDNTFRASVLPANNDQASSFGPC